MTATAATVEVMLLLMVWTQWATDMAVHTRSGYPSAFCYMFAT